MPTSRAGTSTETGFTLIELAVVILLIGLFSALVVPMLTGVGQDELKTTARRLAGTTKYLYNEAALSGRPYRLLFDLDAGTYGGRRLEEDGELVAVTGSGSDRSLPEGVRFRDIVVAGRGRSSSGQTWTAIQPVGWVDETLIHLAAGDERVLTLHLQPLTGSTEVYEGYRDFDNLATADTRPGR